MMTTSTAHNTIASIARALGHGGAKYLSDNFRDCHTMAEALCASARQHFNDEAGSTNVDSALIDYSVTADEVQATTCTRMTSWSVRRDGTVTIRRRAGGSWILGPHGFSGPDEPEKLTGAARTIVIAVLGKRGFAAAFPKTAAAESHEREEYEAREARSRAASDADNAAFDAR